MLFRRSTENILKKEEQRFAKLLRKLIQRDLNQNIEREILIKAITLDGRRLSIEAELGNPPRYDDIGAP